MASNNKAATEDEVGILHNCITKSFQVKIGHSLNSFLKAQEEDDEVAMAMAIDTRDLAAAAKWVQANEVTCAMPETSKNNELKSTLDKIKQANQGKVISFTDKAVGD